MFERGNPYGYVDPTGHQRQSTQQAPYFNWQDYQRDVNNLPIKSQSEFDRLTHRDEVTGADAIEHWMIVGDRVNNPYKVKVSPNFFPEKRGLFTKLFFSEEKSPFQSGVCLGCTDSTLIPNYISNVDTRNSVSMNGPLQFPSAYLPVEADKSKKTKPKNDNSGSSGGSSGGGYTSQPWQDYTPAEPNYSSADGCWSIMSCTR